MSHPSLPSLRAQLSVPRLRFFISAARVRRVMRVLRSALPGQLPIHYMYWQYEAVMHMLLSAVLNWLPGHHAVVLEVSYRAASLSCLF